METESRAARYGVTGVPDVWFDGVRSYVGAGTCEEQVELYRSAIYDALRGDDWLSPVGITGSLEFDGQTATIEATLELLEAGTFEAHQATVFLIEDEVAWCCGYGGQDVWSGVVRMVRSTPVSLTTVGETVVVSETVDVSGFAQTNLRPVVVFEEASGSRHVVQSSNLEPLPYFFVATFPELVASTPEGATTVEFVGTLHNVGDMTDTIELTLDDGFGWVSELEVENGSGTPQSQSVTLASGESSAIAIRVDAEGPARVGTGRLTVSSLQAGHTQVVDAQIFHGTRSARLVTDAGPGGSEARFEDLLAELGQPFDSWITRAEGPPGPGLLRGYDVVIWQNAQLTGNLISPREEVTVRDYLDSDGGLFVSSMGLVGGRSPGDAFLSAYLGVDDWINDAGATEGNGIAGDPISDGLSLTFEWSMPERNDVDVLVPSTGASGILENETGATIGVRYEPESGGRSVFTPFYVEAIPDDALPPNDAATLLGRVLDWVVERDVSSVPDFPHDDPGNLPGGALDSADLFARPQPFQDSVEILLRSDSVYGSDFRLDIFDASGRRVRSLGSAPVQGSADPGSALWSWDGRSDLGRIVPPGVYFARPRSDSEAPGRGLRLIRVE